MKQRVDFFVEVIPDEQSDSSFGLKVGDELLISSRPLSSSCLYDEPTASYLTNTSEQTIGRLPASVKVLEGNVRIGVRSIKKGSDGKVEQVLVRMEAQEDGGGEKREGGGLAGLPGQQIQTYVLGSDEGYLLSRAQLSHLASSASIISALADTRLQKILMEIDASKNPEQALERLLSSDPAFGSFGQDVLQILQS